MDSNRIDDQSMNNSLGSDAPTMIKLIHD